MISLLQQEFIERIGELSVHDCAPNVSNVLRHIEQVISSSMEYVWLMTDQALITGTSIAQGIANHDSVCVRIMIPKGSHIPERYQRMKTVLGNKFHLYIIRVGRAIHIEQTLAYRVLISI